MRTFLVDRGEEFCAEKPCCKTTGGVKGWAFKDDATAADGISKIGFIASEAGKGHAVANGSRGANVR